MTKDEIIENNSDDRYRICYPFNWDMLYKSMNEYAKQQAIEFAKWLVRKDAPYTPLHGSNIWAANEEKDDKTTEQLYELFIQSKQK